MDIAHLYLPGALALWCAVLFSLASLWGYSQVMRGRADSLAFARHGYHAYAASIALASLVMLVALGQRDFRLEYVYQYSGLDLPFHFQLAAFWAGQKGSFMIWLLWGSLIGVPLLRKAGREEAPVMSVYILTLLGLLFILVRENPFVMLGQTPVDGQGLNPLLQDNWMVIHPPIMFIGYALTAVPFAFAFAGLWRRDTSTWAARAFPWALAGFMVLGTAILLGGYWAYKTLGWGGFWGWDPVENASFIPWLFGTVMIHGLHMERTRGRYRRANLVLAFLTYFSVLYGTFLTRSGVLADFSVHSFVDLGISGWLIGLMAFFGLGSLYLLATRISSVPTAPNEDPFFSRGTFMVLGTITILISAILITIGTSAPLLTWFLKNPGQVGPEFYNRVNLPLAILIAFLLGFVPYLPWRAEPPAVVLRKLRWPIVASVAAAVLGVVLGVREPFHVIFLLLASLALTANLAKTIEKGRAQGLRAAGGYLSHIGVGVILIGILASSAYDESTKVTLEKGVPQKVGDYTLTFRRELPRTATEKERMEVEVQGKRGLQYLAYPKMFQNDRTGQMMVNPHIHKLALEDLYISPIEYDPGQAPGGAAEVQLAKNEAANVGPVEVKFLGFDLSRTEHASQQLASGGEVVVGAVLELTRNGERVQRTPTFAFRADGDTASPAVELPGGGAVSLTGVDASSGAVRVRVDGVDSGVPGARAKLALDLTRKPLINFVWYGLYVILIGGVLSMLHRNKELQVLEERGKA